MKIYTLAIDTSSPTRKVIAVPTTTDKYGIAIKATNGAHADFHSRGDCE